MFEKNKYSMILSMQIEMDLKLTFTNKFCQKGSYLVFGMRCLSLKHPITQTKYQMS